MDADEKARLFEEGRSARRRGTIEDVDRSLSRGPADQPFRDGYKAESKPVFITSAC